MPALVGPDGWPLSWAHYVYGMNKIARSRVAAMLDMAEAVRAGKSTDAAYDRWRDERTRIAYRT